MEHTLRAPLSTDDVTRLRVGDIVYLDGIVITARDKAHERLLQWSREGKKTPFDVDGAIIYHCGPLMQENDEWMALSAGPTTSARMSKTTIELLKRFDVRAIIGKGGMAPGALCDKCVYLTYTGGCGVVAAKQIKRVVGAHWLDLGMAEAVWVFDVKEFGPLIVATDLHGNDLFDEVRKKANERAQIKGSVELP
ncbi:MAG: FumA C-terminus/TtdB family hydratase beta subunit [Methanocellales archaeon]|nr:FumA C-terminus/TtdB family hydratase beta subunit [Methanocellales archaeon]